MANMFDQFDGDVATQEKQTVTPKSKNIFDQFDAAPAKALAKGNVFDQFDEQPKTAKEETTPSGPDPMATWLATKPEFRDRLSWQPSEEEKKKAGIEEGPPPESRRFVAAEPVEVTARAQKPRTPEELAQVQALQRQQVEKMGPPPSITTPTTESELKYERDRLEREAKDPVRPIGTLEEEYLANLERPYSRFAEKVLPAKLVQSPLIAAATELLDLPLKGMTSAARAASVEINKLQEAIRAGRPVEAAGRVATTVGELGMGAIAPLPVIQTIMAAQEGIGRISPGAGETITKAMTPAQTLQKKVAPGVKVSPTEEVGQQIVDLAWQLSLFGLGAKGVTKLKNWLIKGEPIAIGEIDAIRKAIEEANIPQEKKQAIQDLIEKAPYIPPEERARAIEGQPPPEQAGVVKSQPDPRVAQIAERVRQLKASNPTLSQADAEAISLQMPLPPPESKIIRPAGEITRREIAEVPPEKVTPLEKPIPAVEEALKPAEEISTLEPMKPRTGPGKEPTKITPQPEGRKIVETAEFKRWFRGSVVVDKSEKPMVVYHGSGADIKSFDPSLRGLGTGAESAKLGFFFTDSREVAQSYADRASSIENLKWLPDSRRVSEKQNELSYGMSRELNDYTTVFLKKHGTDEGALFDNKTLYEEYRRGYDKIAKHYQNQIDVLGRAAEKKHPQREREGKPTIVEAFLSLKHPKIVDAEGKGFVEIDAKGIIAEAKKTGYDGVIIRNVIDNFSLKEEILSDDYIVFSSDQIKITSPEPSRAPEVGAQTVPALKPTEVPTKKPVAQRSTREIVEDQGLRFDGEKRGLIYATDPKTGSTLALPSEGFTPDALAAHVEESRAKFTPEQLAAEAPQAEAKVEEPKPEKERVGIRRYLKSAYGSEFDRIPEMIAAGVKPEVVERLIPPIESAIEKDLNSGRLTDVEAQGLYERLETAKKQVADYRATKIAPARDWEQGGERRFAFDPNSTKNEGRFRLFPPKSVAPELYPEGTKHFRRQSSTPGVSYVMAKRPGEKQAITQAVRFDKKVISESQARDWWEKNKSRPEFQFYGGEKAVAETPKVEAKVEKKAAPAPKPPLSAGDEAWKSAIIGKLSEQGVKDLSDAEIERALAGTVSKTKLTAKAKELVQRGSITLDDVSPTSKPPEMMTEKQPWEMTADEYLRLEERSQAKGAAVTQMSSLIKQGKSPSEAAANAMGFVWNKNPHYDAIKKALSEGKPVPPEVLKDYPDLAEKYAKKPEAPEMTREEYVRQAETINRQKSVLYQEMEQKPESTRFAAIQRELGQLEKEGTNLYKRFAGNAKVSEIELAEKELRAKAEKYAKKREVPEEKGAAGIPGRADKFRQLADQMQGQIDDKHRAMTQNPTPKRMKEYRSRVIEGDDLERAQQALRVLADAHEKGTVPEILRDLKSKSEVLPLVRKGTTGGGGYYDVIASMEYKDRSPQGKALQALMEAKPELRVADIEKQKAQKLAQMEAEVQFRPLPGFFPTPKPLIAKMLDAADIKPEDAVLEPSAGKGDILDAIKEKHPDTVDLVAVENMSPLRDILEAKGYGVGGSDFLEYQRRADKIVMNPPFEKGQDIEHVRHAYDLLKPGGRLVSIMSEGSFSRSFKKETEFRDWLDDVGGTSEKIEPGAFTGKGSFRQTGVASRMVVIDKVAEAKPEPAPEVKAETPEKGIEKVTGSTREYVDIVNESNAIEGGFTVTIVTKDGRRLQAATTLSSSGKIKIGYYAGLKAKRTGKLDADMARQWLDPAEIDHLEFERPIVSAPVREEGVAAAKDYATYWNEKLKLGRRAQMAMDAKWITNAGKLSQLGEKIAESKWEELDPAAQNVLKRHIDELYAKEPIAKPPEEEPYWSGIENAPKNPSREELLAIIKPNTGETPRLSAGEERRYIREHPDLLSEDEFIDAMRGHYANKRAYEADVQRLRGEYKGISQKPEPLIRLSESRAKGITRLDADFGLPSNDPNYYRTPSYEIIPREGRKNQLVRREIRPGTEAERYQPQTISTDLGLFESTEKARIAAQTDAAEIFREIQRESIERKPEPLTKTKLEEAAAAAPKAGLSLKEQKTTLLGELQRAQEVAKRFEQEYKKIDAAEDKVTSVRIEAQNKELEEFEKRKPEPGLVEENERYWKERNAIVDKRSKLGQADYKKFAAQRRIIDDRRADELRKEGFTVEEYRPGKSGMPEKSYRVMTEVPGDGTFYTPIDMLGEGIERIQKGFPTTGGTIPVPKGGGAPSGAGREARPYKNTISKTPDGKYFTVKGEVLIEGEAPKGYKVDELRPEIPLKSVKEILGSGTTDAKLLGYAIKDEVLGYDAVSVKRIPPTDEQPSAIFEANGKYYEINQDRLNLAHEYVKNPTYKLSEDGRALVLLENGKPKAAVGGRPQGESGLKTVTGVSADVMRERFGEQINYLIAPQERGKMPPGPEAKKAAAAKPAEAKPTFEEQTARRRMKEEGLSAEEAARQVISEKYSTLSDKQIEASKGHDSPLGREYRALIEGLKKQVEKPESARPTGTGLATFAVGSLLGIQKDDEGKWVYNPTLGLIGGLGGIALGMLSQKALGALREIESGVAKRGLFPRDAAKALAGEIETYLGTEGKNLPEAEKTQMRKLVNPEKLAEPVAQAEIQAKGESKGQPTPKPIEPLTGQSLKRRNDRIVNEIIRAAKEKAAEKAPRQPSKTILASLKEKIPEYRNDAVREGLNGMDVIERIRERLVDDLSSASEYSEITDARKANAFARLQTENVAGWLRRLEIQQKRWEIEQRVRARRFEIATDLADRIITRDLSVDLQKKLLATSAQFRYTPDTQGKVFAGFKSRVAVMADSYGAAGGELINRMYQGDITRGHFMEIGNDAISRVRDIYDKVDSPFERQRISDAVIDALEDRANPQKHLKTDTQKEIYKIASGLLDEFKSELTARGYAVREDYFTHIKDVDILEQVFNDVLDPRKESVGSLNQMIAARSRFLKPRLDVEMEIRRDLPYVLSTYVRSVSKELAYQNGVEYYYMQFQKDIPVALRRNSMERAMKMMRNTLNPERGRGMFYRSLNFIRSNEYRNFLGMNLKASAQNMTQPEFARWRWSPEADGLRKELWRKRNDLTGPLADAIEVAATDTPRFLEMIKEPGEERNRLVAEKFNQIDTFQMSERRNWSQSELGAILNSAMKEKPYQGFLTKFNGDKLKAVNEVLGNKDAFDRAVRDAAVTSAETQVAASPSMRGEYFDHPLARVALMFTAFRTRQLQILGQALGRQEGMNGARTKAILRRGMSGDVAPVEVLRELETSRKAMEKMLSEAKRVKENLGISYGDVQRYVDYLRLQERDLNRIIQKIEPLGGSRLRRAGMVGRYVAKIAAISLGTGLLWDSVDLAIGDTQKDEKDLIATALWRAFWDVFPSPIYGMNPSKFAVSPVIPNLEHATIYGKFSGRGLSRDALSYLLGALPWVGLVERATGKRISKAALNVAFPPKEKALPKGTMPGSTVPKKSPYQGSSYKKAKGYTYAVPNRSMLDILAETPA